MVAIVFDDANQYREFSAEELGDAPSSVIGFYSIRTNWITTYDLTGIEGVRQPGARPKTSVVINQILSQPAAEPNVATLIQSPNLSLRKLGMGMAQHRPSTQAAIAGTQT